MVKPKKVKHEAPPVHVVQRVEEKRCKFKHCKAIAIVVAVLIVLIAAVVIAKSCWHREAKATVAQMDAAETLVLNSLKANGIDSSSLQIVSSKEVKRTRASKSMLQVCAYNKTSKHAYLVDLISNQIVTHTLTEKFGFTEEKKEHGKEQYEKEGCECGSEREDW